MFVFDESGEPILESGDNAESRLQAAVTNALRKRLSEANVAYVMLESFGLDIAVFLNYSENKWARFLELKAFVGGRPGGVGFGNQKGQGTQIDLLWDNATQTPRSEAGLALLDGNVRWLIADGTIPPTRPRYALLPCIHVQQMVMGAGVKPGKQNNLRISALKPHLVEWPALINSLVRWVLEP